MNVSPQMPQNVPDVGSTQLPNADSLAATPPPTDSTTTNPTQPPASPAGFNWSTAPQPIAPVAPDSPPQNIPTAQPPSQSSPQITNSNLTMQDLYGPSGVAPEPTNQSGEAPLPSPDLGTIAPSSPAPATQTESAPEDLSQLIASQNEPPTSFNPPLSQPQTLITPPNQAVPTATPTEITEHGQKIPKWIIGLGVGLLLLVVAASAYFILGIGQNNQPASAPATTQTQTPIPATPAPTPIATETPVASSSASFGAINPTTQASNSATPKSSGTSAIDLLKQRQGQ